MLACLVLPQQAAAENSVEFAGSTWTISDADPVNEGGTARFEVTTDTGITFGLSTAVTYTAVTADLADLGSGRPTTFSGGGQTRYTIEVPIHDDGIAEGEETFTVQINVFGGATGFDIQATGTINASVGTTPPPTVDISIDGASATEGDDIRFTVNLSAALLEPRTMRSRAMRPLP